MGKRRHAMNPAKRKVDHATIQSEALAADRTLPRGRRLFWLTPVLALLTAGLLNLSFAPLDQWVLAFVALVPWTTVLILPSVSRRWSLLWGWLAGMAFFAVGVHWIWWVDHLGYAALVAYLSAYWFVASLVVRSLLRRGLGAVVVLPVVWVALEYARAYVISGFPWFFLSQSQYSQTRLIQIVDITGEHGLSFFVAMVNGAIVDLMRLPWRTRAQGPGTYARAAMKPVLWIVVPAIVLLGYGTFRLGQQTFRPGPVICLVQRAYPITLAGRTETPEDFVKGHIETTEAAALDARFDLVIWPETMLPKGINADLLQVDPRKLKGDDLLCLCEHMFGPKVREGGYSEEHLREALLLDIDGQDGVGETSGSLSLRKMAQQVGDLSQRLQCPILAGAPTVHRNECPLDNHDLWVSRNSALWFDRKWKSSAEYSKIHLVPFGEYAPYKYTWPWLHRFLRSFIPPVMDQLDPGRSYDDHFELTVGPPQPSSVPSSASSSQSAPVRTATYRIATPICYEGVFARVCRGMVMRDGRKSIDILANISNDGWFVHPNGTGEYRGSTEQPQHLVQYVFRAIENRVPVVRAVNTGISASIDSNGRILGEVRQYGRTDMAVGALALDGRMGGDGRYLPGHGPRVLVDDRVSLYSRIGDLFPQGVCVGAIVMVFWLFRKRKDTLKGPAK